MQYYKIGLIVYVMIHVNFLYCFDYDLIIIGAGAAGTRAAVIACDEFGKKIALIEKNKIGGGRLWHGDIPYKSLYAISKQPYLFFDDASSENKILNSTKVLSHVSNICNEVYEIIYQRKLVEKQIDVFYDTPQFIDNHTISLDSKTLTADKFLIATGSRAYVPPIKGIESVPYLTRENFFDLKKLPSSMIIIGGGPLGVELASALNILDIRMTLVMKHAVLLPSYDYEIVGMITEDLLKTGVSIQCDSNPISVYQKDGLITVVALNRAGKELTFTAEAIFLATGSIPNTEGLGLEKIGVQLNNATKQPNLILKNAIITNSFMQTTVPNIYASGDVTGLHILSRVAFHQAKTAIKNMFSVKKEDAPTNYSTMVKIISSPHDEFASVGLTEQEAIKQFGDNILIYRYKYDFLEKAHIENKRYGLAKFICDKRGTLLGAHILGALAGKMVDILQIGDNLTKYTKEEYLKITGSPSYRDMIYEVSHMCAKDLKDTVLEKPSFLEIIFTPSLWKLNK